MENETILTNGKSDPTALTTALVWREVMHLKELFESRIGAVEQAIEIAHNDLVRVPTDVQRAVQTLKDLHGEKFTSVQTQFGERDTRGERESRDNKVAVDAALQAAKELVAQQNNSNSLAIAKSETGMTKQIDQITTLIQSGNKAVDDKFDDLKERITRIESSDEGSTKTKGDYRWIFGAVLGVAGLAFGVVIALLK